MRASARVGLVVLSLVIAVFLTAIPFVLSGQVGRWLRGEAGSSTPEPPARPNVLIIVTDDQRTETLDEMPRTLAWMGRGGIRFTNAFATTPYCCPSRASIFTGQFVHNHGITHTMEGDPGRLDQRSTLQFHLRRAGYRTAIFGKYLNKWPLRRDPPWFDDWAVFSKGIPGGYSGGRWNVDGRVRNVRQYSTTFIRQRTMRFLRASEVTDERPWFLYLAPFAPHWPSIPEAKYRNSAVTAWNGNPAISEKDRRDKPMFVRKWKKDLEEGTNIRLRQVRTLMSVDDLVDGILELMDRLGEGQNTLAFFLSDNGLLWGEHGMTRKLVPYTPSVSIPLLMRWPARTAGGLEDGRLAANIDIAPTVMEAARLDPDPDAPMDGRSLLAAPGRDRLLLEFWATDYAPTWASLRTEGYQYIEYYDRKGSVQFREYYDLRWDPWQLENLLRDGVRGNEPDVGKMTAQLYRDRSCRGVTGTRSCP
jgi:arylsulfatase A-like enzyme